jgi:hypothetical protein
MVTVALIVPTILGLLTGRGMGPALTRHIVQFKKHGQEGKNRE